MIVPFVFSLYAEKRFELDWVYYKFTSFCYKYNYPIIAQERYDFPIHDHFVNNKVFLNEQQHCWTDVCQFCEEQDKYVDKYFIPEVISENMVNKYDSQENAHTNYLIGENLELESFLEDTIIKIQNKYDKKITAFLNWNTSESLKKVASKYDIKVIHFELAPLRKYNYFHLGYFDFKGVHIENSLEEQYYEFLEKNIQVPMLSNKELLALFLDKKYLEYIYLLDRKPEFKIGVASSGKSNYYDIARGNIDSNELLDKVMGKFSFNDILFRLHPTDPLKNELKEELNNWNLDDSRSSLEFILRCESIAIISSNMAFEAMLLGKKVYNLGQSPYRFFANKDFDDKTKFNDINKFLNFVIFGYFIPFSFMNDAEYLLWRCNEQDIEEIYLKNFRYYSKQFNIDEDELAISKDRLKLILKKKGFSLENSAERYFSCIQDCYNKGEELKEQFKELKKAKYNNEKFNKEIQQLIEANDDLKKEIENVKDNNEDLLLLISALNEEKNSILLKYNIISNSTSWKVTKPLRYILDYIKELKRKGF